MAPNRANATGRMREQPRNTINTVALNPRSSPIKKAIDKAGVLSCVCFECRYSSQFMVTKRVIDQGLLAGNRLVGDEYGERGEPDARRPRV